MPDQNVSLAAAFLAGLLSFLSPCILPLIPAYISYLSGGTLEFSSKNSQRLFTFINSLLFVLGFSLIFIFLGVSASFLGQLINNSMPFIRKISGLVVIAFGLYTMGLLNIRYLRFLDYEKRFQLPPGWRLKYVGSFLLGSIFTFGWIPCVGLVLAGILVLAGTAETVWQGGFLLATYSLGLAVPFLITSLFIGYLNQYLKRVARYTKILKLASGALLVVVGVLIYSNPTAILKNLGSICRAISLIEPQYIVCIQVNDVVGLISFCDWSATYIAFSTGWV
ncbi:cytochrome c biogenesis CcdA family protein [Candidatus Hakubella thermalkaliphila]|uniref:Cytochrome c-type biogenesis protein n=2 Tax=Candidatus Hakubella thermalkaliphila TaxID=2754717 RepID=A0A6V8PIG9_9ACTN|nr:cytochrome c biogenesis protein CcdA [Candidatus Hakubella thermalkaliphila]GFP30756.1 cytochrome c-type biogenesis protein [Candidatus Hakubella thermalkaliphila]GFP39986.1 cytochrome c-type biogenesis protein [Candidatus Hakubella thermalkaliphila]